MPMRLRCVLIQPHYRVALLCWFCCCSGCFASGEDGYTVSCRTTVWSVAMQGGDTGRYWKVIVSEARPGAHPLRISYDSGDSGRERFFALLDVGRTVIDVDGDGTVDVSSDPDPQVPCSMWLPTRLYPAKLMGRTCGSRLSGGQWGLHYVFQDHQWRYLDHDYSQSGKDRTDVVPPGMAKADTDFPTPHRYMAERPIPFRRRAGNDTPGKLFEVDLRGWNGPQPEAWQSKRQQREIVHVESSTGPKFEIAVSLDQSAIDVVIDGRYGATVRRSSKRGNELIPADRSTEDDLRYRLRMMNRVYEDLDGDGQLDGYFERGSTKQTIIVDRELVSVSDCDWEARTARQQGETGKRFRFANGTWQSLE